MSVSPGSGSQEPVPSKIDVQRQSPAGGVRLGERGGRVVVRVARVGHALQLAVVEVHVEQVAARADLEVHGERRVAHEGLHARGVGQPVGRPRASPRCTRGSSQRRTGHRCRRPGTCRRSSDRRRARRSRIRPARGTPVWSRSPRPSTTPTPCVIGPVRRGGHVELSAYRFSQMFRLSRSLTFSFCATRVAGTRRGRPRSRASRSCAPGPVGLGTRFSSSHPAPPTSPIQTSLVPGRPRSGTGCAGRRRASGGRWAPGSRTSGFPGRRHRWRGRSGSASRSGRAGRRRSAGPGCAAGRPRPWAASATPSDAGRAGRRRG